MLLNAGGSAGSRDGEREGEREREREGERERGWGGSDCFENVDLASLKYLSPSITIQDIDTEKRSLSVL